MLNIFRAMFKSCAIPSLSRPYYQTRFTALIAALATLFSGETFIFSCPAFHMTGGKTSTYQENRIIPVESGTQNQPPKNAADSYGKAFSAIDRMSKSDRMSLMRYDPDSDSPRSKHLDEKLHLILGYLETASANECDWGNRLKERGAAAAFPQLSQSKTLAGIATVHAQYLIDEQQIEKAIEIFRLVLIMAHHVGDDGQTGLVGLTTRYQIEQHVFDTIRPNIRQLSKHRKLGALFTIALKKENNLPKIALLLEREVLLPWYRILAAENSLSRQQKEWRETYLGEYLRLKSPDWILEQIDETDQHYVKAGRLMELKFDQFESQFRDYKLELKPLGNPFSQNAIVDCPGIPDAYFSSRKLRAQWTMLKTSTAIYQKGDTAINEVDDPFGDGPFQFQKSNSGFSLQSKLIIDGNRLTVNFR